MDIKQYTGKWFDHASGSLQFARTCVNSYEMDDTPPPAYTLDVGVYGGNFYVIEVHNFYSCGLYGFSMPHLYPQMLSQWYMWWLRATDILF